MDDEPSVTQVLARWLEADGYICSQAGSGADALIALGEKDYPLVVTDIMMPGMTGVELLEKIRKTRPRTAVIMLTGVDDRSTANRALELGAYTYMIKPFERSEVLINVANAFQRRSLEIMRDEYECRLENDVRKRTAEVRRTQEEIILRLTAAAEYRDDETGAHIRRIGLYAAALVQRMGWNQQEIDDIRLAAPMHDVGKIGVPDRILHKPGKLTPEEFEDVKRHTEIGGRLLAGSPSPLLCMARDIALCHHEKWNGSGYPQGLSGEAIPIAAQVVAICDVYDALTHDRVYRPAMSEDKALAIMSQERGSHFAPKVFQVFMVALPGLSKNDLE